jgi:hypothetical protein
MVDQSRVIPLSKLACPAGPDMPAGHAALTAAAGTMDAGTIEALGCTGGGRRHPFLAAYAHPAPGEVLGRTRITKAIETTDDPS